MKQIIIIEHLEPKVWPWCKIEYRSISKLISKNNLWFTNVHDEKEYLGKIGRVFDKSVKDMQVPNVCILDPNADRRLTSAETKKFDFFVIGGILGDYPPKKRTKEELTKFMPNAKSRNLGKKQFSTDNAVYVLKKIIQGIDLEKIKFQNKITIKINKIESIELPYYYPILDGKPRIIKELVEYLKRKRTF